MPIVAPDCARFSILGTFNGVNVATVLDYVVHANGSTDGRAGDLSAVGQRIIDAWCDTIMDRSSDQYIFNEVRVLDLDSATGPAFSITNGDSHALPVAGLLTGQPYAGNTCALVKKLSGGGRGSRSGRMYLPGLTEPNVQGNEIIPGWITTLQAGVDSVLTNTTNTGVTDVPQSFMTIIHTVGGAYVRNTQVYQLLVEPMVATQRRRVGR